MNALESVRVALRSLMASKLRSGMTMLGIVIGVGAVIALVAAGAGAQAQVTQRFESLGSNLLVITTRSRSFRGVAQAGRGGAKPLTNDDVEAIARLAPSVGAIAPEYSLQGSVAYGSSNTRTSVLGITPEYRHVANWSVERGRFVNDLDIASLATVAVLGSAVVEVLFGETLIDPLGKNVKVERENYLVVGLLASKGSAAFRTRTIVCSLFQTPGRNLRL